MAAAGAGAEVAYLYLIARYGDGSTRVRRLVPAWQATRRFAADALGFPPADEDPLGSPAAVQFVAVRNGVLAASVALSPSTKEDHSLGDSSPPNHLELVFQPEHVSLKIFEGVAKKWLSTSIYFMDTANCSEIETFADVNVPKNNPLSASEMMNRNYPGGPPNRFIGYFGDLMYLNFPPVKMGIGIEIIKSADLLGCGSGGRVARCRLCQEYEGALKTCFKNKSTNEPLEVQILSMFHHQHIIQLYYAGLDQENNMFICTELCERTFEDVINQVSEDKVSMIENHLKGIVRGLAEIHRQGVVHRDVKPGNILLDDNNCIRIIDFGHSAFMPAGGGLLPAELCGTALYMSPEIKCKLSHDLKSDVFSFGITYFASFGRKTSQIKQLLDKVHFSSNWNIEDGNKSWNNYKFAKGWQGNVTLLRKLLRTEPDCRPTMPEVLELLSSNNAS